MPKALVAAACAALSRAVVAAPGPAVFDVDLRRATIADRARAGRWAGIGRAAPGAAGVDPAALAAGGP